MNSSAGTAHNKTGCVLSIETQVTTISTIIIIIIGITWNSLVLYKFQLFKSKNRLNIEVLIIYLSFSDIIALITHLAGNCQQLTCNNWQFGTIGCILIYPTYYVSTNFSAFLLLIMAFERCRSIVFPMKKKLTKCVIHCIVFISAIASFALQWYQFNAMGLNEGSCSINAAGFMKYTVGKLISTLIRDMSFVVLFSITTLLIRHSLYKQIVNHPQQNKQVKQENGRVINLLIIMQVIYAVLVLPWDIWDSVMIVMLLYSGNINFT